MGISAIVAVDEVAEQQVNKRLGRRKLTLIVIAFALFAVIGGALWFSSLLRHNTGNSTGVQHDFVAEKPILIDVPDIITNLDNGSHRAVFVKLKAKVEIAHLSDQAAINADMPRILDAFQTYMRSLRPEELHGGEGTYRLREALMNRINIISSPIPVLDILFIEMLVQ